MNEFRKKYLRIRDIILLIEEPGRQKQGFGQNGGFGIIFADFVQEGHGLRTVIFLDETKRLKQTDASRIFAVLLFVDGDASKSHIGFFDFAIMVCDVIRDERGVSAFGVLQGPGCQVVGAFLDSIAGRTFEHILESLIGIGCKRDIGQESDQLDAQLGATPIATASSQVIHEIRKEQFIDISPIGFGDRECDVQGSANDGGVGFQGYGLDIEEWG